MRGDWHCKPVCPVAFRVSRRASCASGYALLIVLVFAGIGLLALSSILNLTASNAHLAQRTAGYYRGLAAAEAATEKVLARLSQDFQKYGQATVDQSQATYRQLFPTEQENATWKNFEFKEPLGSQNRTYVSKIADWAYTALDSAYGGLYGYASTYRIVSNARDLTSPQSALVGLKQDIQIASIPMFQFALFYAPDLEISPNADLKLTGRVHGNGCIYAEPDQAKLTYQEHVTAAQKISHANSPADPVKRVLGQIIYEAEHDQGVNSLNLPIGTHNSPQNLHALLDIPPASESTNSPLGQQRYYNKADLIILVADNPNPDGKGKKETDDLVIAVSGTVRDILLTTPLAFLAPLADQPPSSTAEDFVDPDVTFFNKRENKTIQATEIDLDEFRQKYSTLKAQVGRDIKILFVADIRSQTGGTQSGVRLINGQTLPPYGLTVVTPNPLYVQGHFNASAGQLETTNTSQTLPASLLGDAVTILSDSWKDNQSGLNLHTRKAKDTTVNAAIIAGIVPTSGGYYSGGAENAIRLLEDWEGKTLTFNGSLVVLYFSQVATAPWGASGDVYLPPKRMWSRDSNFLQANKLPPGTPELRTIIRAQWTVVGADSVQ